jgi:hypothetical protein
VQGSGKADFDVRLEFLRLRVPPATALRNKILGSDI